MRRTFPSRWTRTPFTRLTLETMEDRTVPTVTVNGTAGADVIASRYFFDNAASQYRGEVTVMLYAFKSDTLSHV